MKIKLLLLAIFGIALFLLTYKITNSPPGLHGDELGYAYNAYSLLTTGKDEYGISFPLTFRNDFDPFVIYAYMLPVAIFGLNDTVVRIYTALVGILIIFVIYKLLNLLFSKPKLSLLSIFFISLSSWFIRINRVSVSIIWALLFQLIGIYFFYIFINKRKYLLLSFVFFGLSVITYQSAKITTPLIIIYLLFSYKDLLKNKYHLLITYLLFFIILPILIYVLIRPFNEMRFTGINIFIEWKNSLPINQSLISIKSVIYLIIMFIKNYFKHFNLKLLFIDNSNLRYFQLNNLGLFYLWQLPFILLGLLHVFKNLKNKIYQFLFYLIIISPIPSSFTSGIPYANVFRNLLFMPFIEIICAIGILRIFNILRNSKILNIILISLIVINCCIYFPRFLYQYYINNSHANLQFWGKPFKEIIPLVLKLENSVDKIIMTNPYSQSYMYYLFYGNKDPQWLLKQYKVRNKIVGYSKIGNYEFRPINWDKDKLQSNALIIGTDNEIPVNNNIIFESYNSYNNQIMLRIVKTN